MQKITHNALAKLLAARPGAFPVGLLADYDARARKTGNPYGAIEKRIRAIGFTGAEYAASVAREGERQTGAPVAFAAGKLPFGDWLTLGKVIIHNGELYLRVQTTPGQRKRQPARVLSYRAADGRFISAKDAAPFLPPVRESAKQEEAGLGAGTVHVRTYAFRSIRRVRVNGQTLALVP